jgi:hypothetical protein
VDDEVSMNGGGDLRGVRMGNGAIFRGWKALLAGNWDANESDGLEMIVMVLKLGVIVVVGRDGRALARISAGCGADEGMVTVAENQGFVLKVPLADLAPEPRRILSFEANMAINSSILMDKGEGECTAGVRGQFGGGNLDVPSGRGKGSRKEFLGFRR